MAQKAPQNLSQFLARLRQEGELIDIQLDVDPHLVAPEIQRRIVAEKGKALLIHGPKNAQFPLAMNLFGSSKRIELAFGTKPGEVVQKLAHLIEKLPPKPSDLWRNRGLFWDLSKLGIKRKRRGPVLANQVQSLDALPLTTSWPEDGGPFITLPLVYTEHPQTGKGNLGMYRLQKQGPKQTGMHIQIHRGGGNHFHEAEKAGQDLPACVFVGGPPALILAAIAPLPEDVPELAFASLLLGKKLEVAVDSTIGPLPMVAEADFCLVGHIPANVREPEGPFGDHYGYYSLQHDYPIFKIDHIFHRDNATFPATVVGRPPQEDHYLAIYLQDLLSPIFPIVLKGVKDVFAFEESGVHSLAAAKVRERYPKEAFTAAMRVLGEGQLSLSKVLLVTEADLNIRDFRKLFEHIVARMDPRTDLHILSHISMDTLDYSGPAINQGSKAIMLGLGDARFELETKVPPQFGNAQFHHPTLFCPGVLVVGGPAYRDNDKVPESLHAQPEVKPYRVVVLHDEPQAAAASAEDFLWHVFTRFEPAANMFGNQQLVQNHISFEAPLIIDARMKPGYPDVLVPDPDTLAKVDQIWDQLGLDG